MNPRHQGAVQVMEVAAVPRQHTHLIGPTARLVDKTSTTPKAPSRIERCEACGHVDWVVPVERSFVAEHAAIRDADAGVELDPTPENRRRAQRARWALDDARRSSDKHADCGGLIEKIKFTPPQRARLAEMIARDRRISDQVARELASWWPRQVADRTVIPNQRRTMVANDRR